MPAKVPTLAEIDASKVLDEPDGALKHELIEKAKAAQAQRDEIERENSARRFRETAAFGVLCLLAVASTATALWGNEAVAKYAQSLATTLVSFLAGLLVGNKRHAS